MAEKKIPREGTKAYEAYIKREEKKKKALQEEKERMYRLFEMERAYGEEGYQLICGVDEAGRGPLAGPVVAGAVIFPKDCDILYINDSKKLSKKKREELYDIIREKALYCGVGFATVEEIDRVNVLEADYLAMQRAIEMLGVVPDLLLNDAVTIPKEDMKQVSIIKGDAKSASIGAASILAKVTRDHIMESYDQLVPEYGFAKHAGYGTKAHYEAIEAYGILSIHRRTFLQKRIDEGRLSVKYNDVVLPSPGELLHW
ncbi:MAG: ribonuclease HII [Lachnospiraceae bacterium]|nr:ribonuclease HII [Lachnospiraceae bacterium]